MKAMILAAGEGRRMRPLTLHTPKPLLRIGEKPLIVHHLERLRDAGIVDIVINLSYLGDQIRAALGDGSTHGVTIEYSFEPEPLETAGAVYRALPLLGQQPFLLLNGDVWTDYPLQQLREVAAPAAGAHLVLVPNPSHHPTGDFLLNASGEAQFLEDTQEQIGCTFSGLSLMDPAAVSQYPRRREKFPLREVFEWAIGNHRLTGEMYAGLWVDVGTPERLTALRALV